MPAVSVIVPTYNCARWLAESLDSVLGQADADTEILVVDDGSTDETQDLLQRYAGVRVIGARHGGIAPSRNLGLAEARGEWIAFHDADDVALPDRIDFQRRFLAAEPRWEAVFCNGERLGEPGTRIVPAKDRAAGEGAGAHAVRRATFRVQPDAEYGYRLFGRARAVFVDRVSPARPPRAAVLQDRTTAAAARRAGAGRAALGRALALRPLYLRCLALRLRGGL